MASEACLLAALVQVGITGKIWILPDIKSSLSCEALIKT